MSDWDDYVRRFYTLPSEQQHAEWASLTPEQRAHFEAALSTDPPQLAADPMRKSWTFRRLAAVGCAAIVAIGLVLMAVGAPARDAPTRGDSPTPKPSSPADSSAPATGAADTPSPAEAADFTESTRRRANSDDAQSAEEALFHAAARALVIRHIEPNTLGVGGSEFRVKRNPVGPGCFVYDPRTRFSGVERNLLWLVVDETSAYATNGPSKMVTPELKWPREDGIRAPSTIDLVAYVFKGKPLSAPQPEAEVRKTATATFTVAEYRIYRDVMDTPMSIAEAEAVRKAAAAHGVSAAEARAIVKRINRLLAENGWIGPAPAEIKHASDWNGESR